MPIKLIIPGNPIAKKRPRFARRGKFVKTYNDQETEESKFLFHVMQQWKGELIENTSIAIHIKFCMKRPKSDYGTGRNTGKLKKSAPVDHIKKPDIDNMIKFVLDVLNGHVYHDDSLINYIASAKCYCENPRTEITIT